MNINKKMALGWGAVIVVVITGISIATLNQRKDTARDLPAQGNRSQQQGTREQKDILSYKGVTGKTALELLKEQAAIETKSSSYGTYVDSINGLKGGTDGRYWTFYVDGVMATSGADTYQTKDGENIEWKFQ